MKQPIFIEFQVVSSGLICDPSNPSRLAVINLNEIASVEDIEISDKPLLGMRCKVTLFEPADDVLETEDGDMPLRGRRTLTVKNTYKSVVALLAQHAVIVKPE